MYIYIYIYIYTHTHTRSYMHTPNIILCTVALHTHTYTNTYTHIQTFITTVLRWLVAHPHTYTYTYIHHHTHTNTYTHIHTGITTVLRWLVAHPHIILGAVASLIAQQMKEKMDHNGLMLALPALHARGKKEVQAQGEGPRFLKMRVPVPRISELNNLVGAAAAFISP